MLTPPTRKVFNGIFANVLLNLEECFFDVVFCQRDNKISVLSSCQPSISSVQAFPIQKFRPGKEGKLGAYAMKRVAASAHLPIPWLFEPAKR